MVESIMEINRMESGKLELSRTNFELEELIKESISEHKILAEEYQVGIIFEPGENSHIVKMDEEKIQRVISNLVDNALKFTPEGGRITFSADVNGPWAVISLSDTGIGIPEDKIDRVFERFFQVEDSLTRAYEGMGLGLAIVRGMVNVCGGEIHVISQPGQGTTFTFTLPLDNSNVEQRPLQL
jgi:signal transduction histidine kinase